MGLYHFGLYLLIRQRDRVPLYFAGVCLVAALRSLSQGEGYLVEMFPQMSWNTFMGFSYLTFYLAVLTLCLYVYSLFPKEYTKKILNFTFSFSLIFSIFVVFTPAKLYTHTLQIFQVFSLLVGFHILYVMFQATRNKRDGAYIFILSFAILFATVIHDFLFFNGIIQTGHIAVFGMFAMIFSQSFLVSHRFSLIFFKAEELSEELDVKNRSLIEYEKIKAEIYADEINQVRQRLNELLNTLDEGIISLDGTGIITYANRKALDLFAYDSEKIKYFNIEMLFPDLRNEVSEFEGIGKWDDADFKKLSRTPLRINGKRSDKSTFPIRIHFRKLELEDEEYSLVLTHSVEDSKIQQLSSMNMNPGMNIDDTKNGPEFRQLLVYVLQLSMENWEQSAQKTKVQFAKESQIWKVQSDQGTPRVRTLEKYLNLESLPKRPHWKKVYLTANYILDHCPLLPSHRKNLENALEKLILLSLQDHEDHS